MKHLIALFIILLTACAPKEPVAPHGVAQAKQVERPATDYYTDFPQEYTEEPAGAVFDGFNLEMSPWTVCVEEAKVYSGPEANPDWYLYSLPNGTPVTVRELDLGTRTFAAIKVAHYTKFTNLCQAEE